MSATRTILITGGTGFIGSNLAERLLNRPNTRVRIFDDLSRRGVAHNLAWLQSLSQSARLEWIPGDIRDASEVARAAEGVAEVYHLAAQVAVTTSVDVPRDDFEVNVLGTFNILEAARRGGNNPFLLFTSTNKVYGSLHGVPVEVAGTQYRGTDPNFRGVTESEPLDFHSPYGCSKGAADQYVRDYARIYNLPTVVFRMSCIAGPRQFGTEDQGWIAHFLYSVLERKPITIYGDGYQVRDVLHVHDLLDAMEAAHREAPRTAGEIYNIGGGPRRTVGVVDALRSIHALTGIPPLAYKRGPPRRPDALPHQGTGRRPRPRGCLAKQPQSAGRLGFRARPHVPIPRLPGVRHHLRRAADEQAWERAHNHYLHQFSHRGWSDIQSDRPLTLAELERPGMVQEPSCASC